MLAQSCPKLAKLINGAIIKKNSRASIPLVKIVLVLRIEERSLAFGSLTNSNAQDYHRLRTWSEADLEVRQTTA